jgi:hypothetical protein
MISFFKSKKTFRRVFANNSVFNLHFMKVSTENDNNFGYEKITILVDNMPLSKERLTRYDYNLTIMKSPKPATDNRFKWITSYLWNRTMLNFCGIMATILKMETGRNFSMSGINSGHHNLPTYEMSLKSDNVEFVRYCGGHFENGDR